MYYQYWHCLQVIYAGRIFEKIKAVVEQHGDIAPLGRNAEDAARKWDMYGF
jgi:hypothetical protein